MRKGGRHLTLHRSGSGLLCLTSDWHVRQWQGATYRAKQGGTAGHGKVALVLGAGNQAPVVCFDILHLLLVEDAVVVCKMNPVNDYLGPYIR